MTTDWEKFKNYVEMSTDEQKNFIESKCKDREHETYCIYCEEVVAIDTLINKEVKDEGKNGQWNNKMCMSFCPYCMNEIHDYWL